MPNPDKTRVEIYASAQLAEYLDRLVAAGIYGSSRPAVAERLLSEKIREMLKSGEIERNIPDRQGSLRFE